MGKGVSSCGKTSRSVKRKTNIALESFGAVDREEKDDVFARLESVGEGFRVVGLRSPNSLVKVSTNRYI